MVSFQGLLTGHDTLADPAVIEGMFHLLPPGSAHQLADAPQETEPVVGVSVSLRLEQEDNVGTHPDGGSSPLLAGVERDRQVHILTRCKGVEETCSLEKGWERVFFFYLCTPGSILLSSVTLL